MSEVIHITENANQPAARVSALSLSELGVLIGNSLPTADPLTVGEIWNNNGIVSLSPTPLVVSDFKNGVYSINGVTKTVDDLWVKDTDWRDDWTTADIIAGVGFVTTKSDTLYYAPGPVATAAVNTAIGDEYTIVVEYEFETNKPTQSFCVLNFTATVFATQMAGWYCGIQQTSGDPQTPFSALGDFGVVGIDIPESGFGSHKAAITFSQPKLMLCTDGDIVYEALNPQANIPSDLGFGTDANTDSGGAGTTVTITVRKITILPLISDSSTLQQLSV